MRKHLLISAGILLQLFATTIHAIAQAPDPLLIDVYNGPVNKFDGSRAMVVDPAGNVYVTGTSDGKKGNPDYVTIKYNAQGIRQWVARYNGTGNADDYPFAIAVDPMGNVYVTGRSMGLRTNYDYATVKYNAAGEQKWVARYLGTLHDIAHDVQVDAAGNVYVTGFSDGANSINGNAITTIKYDPEGKVVWSKSYNGLPDLYDGSATNKEEGNSLALDGSGNVYVTGQSSGMITLNYDSDGNAKWLVHSRGANGRKVLVGPDNNIVITGWGSVTAKYDPLGNLLREMIYVNAYGNEVAFQDMALDEAGNIYVTGYSRGSNTKDDFTTVKYDAVGVQQWDAYYNGSMNGIDLARSIALDGLGYVYVTGRVEIKDGSRSGTTNYGTVKYNASTGAEQWVALFDSPDKQSSDAFVVATDATGQVFVTGQSAGKTSYFDIVTIKYPASQNVSPAPSTISNRSILEQTTEVPLFSLNSYPNPFSKATTIDFQIPQSGKVRLSVFDLSGKEVAILVNGFRPAGKYRVRFAANGLAAGTYYSRLQFGGFVDTRKLILSR